MIDYEISFLIAILAVVYTYILTQPGQLFNGLYNKLDKFFKTDTRRSNGKSEHPLFKILIYCHLCLSGQVALWLFIYFNWINYFINPFYTLLSHVFTVATTILMAAIIKGIYTKHIE